MKKPIILLQIRSFKGHPSPSVVPVMAPATVNVVSIFVKTVTDFDWLWKLNGMYT